MTPQAGSQAPKKALLKGLLCCLFIALGLTSTQAKAYLETNDLLPKNRVWENFSPSPETSWGKELQSKETQGKNSFQSQKTASGVSLWTQRDPIEEKGGVNLYGFVYNIPLNAWDRFGLRWVALGNGKNHYRATSDKDTLEGLAYKVSGFIEDWSCLWPVSSGTGRGQSGMGRRYPKVCKGDVYDISNLVTNDGEVLKLLVAPDLDYLFISGRERILPGRVANKIKHVSGEGGTPISYFFMAGHGGVGGYYGNRKKLYKNWRQFNLTDLTALDKAPSFKRANKKKGPIRCWFTRSATAIFSGCDTNSQIAQPFANSVLRKNAISWGTDQTIGTSGCATCNGSMYLDPIYDKNKKHIGWGRPNLDYWTSPAWVSNKGNL